MSTSKGVIDLVVIQDSGLPESVARKYINELDGLRLITIDRRIGGADIEGKPYRLINLKTNGIKALQHQGER